ncbi:MAG: zinc ribbon domain-containing protein [Planctomycetota bacterium]
MPTYDYACRACGHEFELFQSMTEPVKRKCPACSKLKLERLIGTGAGVIFKGGGFYETDYRSESYKKAAEADKKSSEPAKTDDSSKKKSDTTASSEAPKKKKAPAKKSSE